MTLRRPFAASLTLFLLLFGLATARAADAGRLVFETATGSHAFSVELAATPQQREVGLMYRRSLAEDRGMLFDFGAPQAVSMWMQNTYVSLDMVFVREDGRVRRVEERTEPLSTRIVSSGAPVRYVVEIVGGAAARIGLKPGDRVIHPRIGK
jgi:uncharacterized membrane protein (UPF0127 family)